MCALQEAPAPQLTNSARQNLNGLCRPRECGVLPQQKTHERHLYGEVMANKEARFMRKSALRQVLLTSANGLHSGFSAAYRAR